MRLTILLIAALLFSCKDKPLTQFTKLPSSQTGIKFNNVNLEDENFNVLVYEYFYNGGGVALGDINNDGLTDIYFSANQLPNRLYLNKGNFTFEDITLSSGTGARDGWKTGVTMADVNGDGLLDIYVCRSAANIPAQRQNSLFINQGNLTFKDEAAAYGLNDDSYSTQAVFFDFDRDDDLDLFLLNHSVSSIVRNFDIRTEDQTARIPFVANKLFENRNGKFVDVSSEKGINGPAHNYGLGVSCSDLNNDGWIDLYASNDYTGKDYLLINQQGRFFKDCTDSLLSHISRFSMGTDIADVNNDGLTDILTLDMLPDNNLRQKELFWPEQYDVHAEMIKNGLHHQYMRNMLHLNNGNGKFSEVGQLSGISNTDWSWSALFADFDNDGLQDLFVSNGYKRDYTNNDFLKYRADQMMAGQFGRKAPSYTTLIEKIPSSKLHNYVFKNGDGLLFNDVSLAWGFDEQVLTHGAAFGDLDNDGDLDLVMNNMDAEAGIYRNNSEKFVNNNYLKVKLNGKGLNKMALGAKVSLFMGGKKMIRELNPNRGFQSTVDPILHFGVGKQVRIDSLIVEWTNGKHELIKNILSNQTMFLDEKNATSANFAHKTQDKTFFVNEEIGLPFTHKENDFIDFKVQSLLPRMYSHEGPALASADVNGDNIADVYVGGAKGQMGQLMIQNRRGNFTSLTSEAFALNKEREEIDALFFDMDGDHDDDLYVVNGGYEFNSNDPALQDCLFRNERGKFVSVPLPEMLSSGSCVRSTDVDKDGDIDLFVGGRVVPGRYPETPESYILENDGHGNFAIATSEVCPELNKIGMVTDAVWLDLNNDKYEELILVGEWMEIRCFANKKGKLFDVTTKYFQNSHSGFWNSILAHDFDHDGDADLVVGNYGLNNQIKATVERPARMYYHDFDNNGSVDPILCYYVQDKCYPFPSRDELTEQIPSLKKLFLNYHRYAIATVDSIFSKEQLAASKVLKADCFETTYFQNEGGKFVARSLPVQIQFAPVNALAAMDVNHDGHDDLIAAGNISNTRVRTGMLNGNGCFIFINDGSGNFTFCETAKSGINFSGDVRHLFVNDEKLFIVANNAAVKSYTLRRPLKNSSALAYRRK